MTIFKPSAQETIRFFNALEKGQKENSAAYKLFTTYANLRGGEKESLIPSVSTVKNKDGIELYLTGKTSEGLGILYETRGYLKQIHHGGAMMNVVDKNEFGQKVGVFENGLAISATDILIIYAGGELDLTNGAIFKWTYPRSMGLNDLLNEYKFVIEQTGEWTQEPRYQLWVQKNPKYENLASTVSKRAGEQAGVVVDLIKAVCYDQAELNANNIF